MRIPLLYNFKRSHSSFSDVVSDVLKLITKCFKVPISRIFQDTEGNYFKCIINTLHIL
jgi:hypothetical protein